MIKPNLSQSLLKDYVDFYDPFVQSCGHAIRLKHYEKIKVEPSGVRKLGIYFEYMATGYHNINEPKPEAEYVYKNTAKERLAADYERANLSAEYFKRIIKMHGIEVIKYGEYMKHEDISGISDIRAIWNGEECIIDMKYTSLFDDKFSDYGWHTESLPYKSKLLLQPIHYKVLGRKLFNIDSIPFYFFIFSAKDPEKVKIIKTTIQEEHINLHEEITIPKMRNYVDFHFKNPDKLEPRPNYLRCMDCDFADKCQFRALVPLVEEINY